MPLVLIVEDNPVNAELMDYLLRAFGYQTASATEGRSGLELARRERPGLILCDIEMPVLDGFAFARTAKAEPELRDIPLLAVTASAMVGDRDRILQAGFDGYVAKPIDPQEFLRTVAMHLKGAAPDLPARPPPETGPRDTPRGTILVLDDTASNLALKRDLLEPHGYRVLTADGIDAAWALALEHRPQLILSDVGMRSGSGFDFIRRVKADERLRDIPFVFLSATHWDSNSEAIGLQLGAMRYLRRPIDPRKLLDEIAACIAA
jgi:two-component system cell cycle response regulator